MKKRDFIEIMHQAQAPLKRMVEMVPEDKINWAPAPNFMTVGQVLRHLAENWRSLEFMLTDKWPFKDMSELEASLRLENMPSCGKKEALIMMEEDLNEAISFIENSISEEEFFQKIVTAPWGFQGEIWKAVLMLKDHLLNHKMQLHIYLKLLGLPVNTLTLYGG